MSNSASISAAKKRRGGAPPPLPTSGGGGQNMSLPPGLPPNFRQLPPHIQQQLFQQLQQKMNPAMAAAKVASPQAPTPMHHPQVVQGQAQQHAQQQAMAAQQGYNVPGATGLSQAYTGSNWQPPRWMFNGVMLGVLDFANEIWPEDCPDKTHFILKYSE